MPGRTHSTHPLGGLIRAGERLYQGDPQGAVAQLLFLAAQEDALRQWRAAVKYNVRQLRRSLAFEADAQRLGVAGKRTEMLRKLDRAEAILDKKMRRIGGWEYVNEGAKALFHTNAFRILQGKRPIPRTGGKKKTR